MSVLEVIKRKPLLWLYTGGAVLLVICGWLWWAKISTNPQRVFWATVSQGLSTRGVTVSASHEANGTSIQQTEQYSFGATNISHTVTTLKQGNTTVKSEIIGTPDVDYDRYTGITTDLKSANGKSRDFSKLIGVWAHGPAQSFAHSVLGTTLPLGGMGIPIGDLSPTARANLIKEMQNDTAYQVAFNSVKKQRVHGRLQYVYSVDIEPVAYIALLQQFAKDVGVHGLEQLNPSDYRNQAALTVDVTVDVRARQIVALSVPNGEYSQTYSSYGVPVQVAIPKNPISTTQLQQMLSQVQ